MPSLNPITHRLRRFERKEAWVVTVLEGDGSAESCVREVVYVYDARGNLIAHEDPMPEREIVGVPTVNEPLRTLYWVIGRIGGSILRDGPFSNQPAAQAHREGLPSYAEAHIYEAPGEFVTRAVAPGAA